MTHVAAQAVIPDEVPDAIPPLSLELDAIPSWELGATLSSSHAFQVPDAILSSGPAETLS